MLDRVSKIRVLLVDDHNLVRAGVARQLDSYDDIMVIGQAASGEEGIQLARALQPDVVLMDLRMPGIGGYEAARHITAALDRCVVIAVTASEQEPEAWLRRCGIAACVVKTADSGELGRVIRQQFAEYRRQAMRDPGRDGIAEPASPFDCLTGREMQLLTLTAQGKTPTDVAHMLHLSPKSIYTYRYRLYAKLGVSNDVEMLNLAHRFGVVLE